MNPPNPTGAGTHRHSFTVGDPPVGAQEGAAAAVHGGSDLRHFAHFCPTCLREYACQELPECQAPYTHLCVPCWNAEIERLGWLATLPVKKFVLLSLISALLVLIAFAVAVRG